MPTKVAAAVNTPLKRFESAATAASLNTIPPAYSAKAEQPPAYPSTYNHVPTAQTIGGKTLSAPLVQIQDLKAHLCLLRAFKDLRTVVEADPGTHGSGKSQTGQWPELAKKLDGPRRWTWFLGLAVDRFQAWLRGVKPSSDVSTWVQEELPPIDVLMVWHAYLLNPMWYAEDCDRLKVLAPLKSIDPDILVKAIVSVGDISTHEPSAARIDTWEKQTGTFFDPLYAASHASTRDVDCPACFKSFSVPYLKADGKGYTQANFVAKCPSCDCGNVTKETLALLKFARDAVLDPNNTDDLEEYGMGCFQAGTLRTMLNQHDTAVASAVKEQLREALAPAGALKSITNREDFLKHIMVNSKFSLTLLASRAGPSLKRSRPRRVMSAYTDDRPFSIDLVGAVSRQCSFIDKMHHFGWAEPGCFDEEEDEAVLVHSIARYHAFLDLLSSAPTSFFVPTLDIDLAWHTHQMFGTPYHTACITYVQRFIDHDDQVEENYLSNAFDITCRAWESRFGMPYSYCGCPLPGATIGQRLSRLKLKLSVHKASCSALAPLQRPDALSATHASEHNAVFQTGHRSLSEAARKRREMKVRQRRERDEKAAREGKMDAESVRRGAEHDAAFLYPVPFYVPVAGCVAVGVSGAAPASCEPLFSCSSGRISCMAGGCCNGVGGCGGGGCGGGCGGGGCGGGGCGGGGGN